MCCLFGFVANSGRRVDLDLLYEIGVHNENSRAGDAFGFAWMEPDGRVRTFKKLGRLRDNRATLQMLRRAILIVGHGRWATHGDKKDHVNNHPHPAPRGGWYAHNGVISDYLDHYKEHNIIPRSQCDSEVIGHLMRKAPKGSSLAQRVKWAVEKADPGTAMAIMGIWPNRGGTIIATRRNGQPLHASTHEDGSCYIASLAPKLPGKPYEVKDNYLNAFSVRDGCWDGLEIEAKETRSYARSWSSYGGHGSTVGYATNYSYRGRYATGSFVNGKWQWDEEIETPDDLRPGSLSIATPIDELRAKHFEKLRREFPGWFAGRTDEEIAAEFEAEGMDPEDLLLADGLEETITPDDFHEPDDSPDEAELDLQEEIRAMEQAAELKKLRQLELSENFDAR